MLVCPELVFEKILVPSDSLATSLAKKTIIQKSMHSTIREQACRIKGNAEP